MTPNITSLPETETPSEPAKAEEVTKPSFVLLPPDGEEGVPGVCNLNGECAP